MLSVSSDNLIFLIFLKIIYLTRSYGMVELPEARGMDQGRMDYNIPAQYGLTYAYYGRPSQGGYYSSVGRNSGSAAFDSQMEGIKMPANMGRASGEVMTPDMSRPSGKIGRSARDKNYPGEKNYPGHKTNLQPSDTSKSKALQRSDTSKNKSDY